MRINKSFITIAEIAMSINLENAKRSKFLTNGFHKSKRSTVITSEKRNQFSPFKQGPGLLVYPMIQEIASFINLLQGFAHKLVVIYNISLRNIIYVEFGFLSEVITF